MQSKQKHHVSRLKKQVQKHGVDDLVRQRHHETQTGVNLHHFRIKDGYHQPRYKIERLGSAIFARRLEAYLAKRPHLDFKHSRNRAKQLLYTLPTFPDWKTLMPGALALEPIHHPEQKKLTTGKRIDPISRRLFRHGIDAIAIRARTVMAGWIARQYVKQRPNQQISWLSLAGGTSAPSMLMVEASKVNRSNLRYANIDQDQKAIKIARDITEIEGLPSHQTSLLAGNIFDKTLLAKATRSEPVDIIDMMGIFEYLDREESIELLKLAYGLLKKDGLIVTCNMRADHHQLNLHKRGIGWPDVRPRSAEELIDFCHGAAISSESIDIYQPDDGIYNVLRISKN